MTDFTIEQLDSIYIIRFTSAATSLEVIKSLDELASLPDANRRLWDITKGINLSTSELQTVSLFAKHTLPVPAKIALVTATSLDYGIARQHVAYRNQLHFEESVFQNESDAIKWLQEPFKKPKS